MNHIGQSPPPFTVRELLAEPPAIPGSGAASDLVRGAVVSVLDDGVIVVQTSPDECSRIACDFLETGQGQPPGLGPGDLVLVLRPAVPGQNGCVLGRIGRYKAPEPGASAPPDHVVIEAGESLTIKCGEGEIGMRKDGKLLIRGNDVVSRARRTQRIKGGTVAIN